MTAPASPDSRLLELARIWRQNPAQMVSDLFHVKPDAWQLDVLQAFPHGQRLRQAMQACAGPGKSAVLAWLGWNFLLCYGEPGHFPQGAALSITSDNLKNGLWKELAFWRERSPLLKQVFSMTSEAIREREHPDLWFLSARSWSKTAKPDEQGRTLSGLHSRYICYLMDEIGDIGPAVLRAANQGFAQADIVFARMAAAGNPTSHAGMLYHIVTREPDRWQVTRVTGDPDDPKRSPRIDLEEAKASIATWGRDNAWVMAYVLGQFPPTSINALLGPDDVAAAQKRQPHEEQYRWAQKRIGIDIARFGDDSTVLFPRQGIVAFNPVQMRNARTEEIAARIMTGKQNFGSELELIDETGGYAAGVIDACRLGGVNLYPVNFSAKADDPRFFNKRSEIHFRAAEWVTKQRGHLPPTPQVALEAVAPTYWFEKGKLRVAEKEQIKKDLQGHSPDFWDAFCVTFGMVDMPSAHAPDFLRDREELAGPVTEWDPFNLRA